MLTFSIAFIESDDLLVYGMSSMLPHQQPATAFHGFVHLTSNSPEREAAPNQPVVCVYCTLAEHYLQMGYQCELDNYRTPTYKLLVTHCVPFVLDCSDEQSADVATGSTLDGRQHDDDSLVPDTASNGSTVRVPEAPTEAHIAKQMDTLAITNCTPKSCGAILPGFYLAVVAEPTAEDFGFLDCFSAQTRAAMEEFRVERRDVDKGAVKGAVQGGEPYGGELYEKGVASHGDSTFQKFYKRISSCPSQGLRCVYNAHRTVQCVYTAYVCGLPCLHIQYMHS